MRRNEKLVIPQYRGVGDHYFILDSTMRNSQSSLRDGKLVFHLAVNQPTQEGQIGIKAPIHMLIELEVSSFLMPRPDAVPYITNTLGTDPNLPILSSNPGDEGVGFNNTIYHGRIGINIPELCEQSSSIDGGNTHFEFDVQDVPNNDHLVRLVPVYSRFILTRPVPELTQLTLQFLNPIQPLPLPQCSFYTPLVYGNTIVFRHQSNWLQGDRFQIHGFQHSDSVLANYVNRAAGHLAGPVIGNLVTMNPAIRSPVDQPPQSVHIRLLKNRIRVPFRARCLTEHSYNRVLPT